MSGLEQLVRRMIRREGPIDVARYMALALGHPEHGYYRKRDPFGAAGDFTTAPEMSQMFGELIGLVLAAAWQAAGRPPALSLVELGPGRGTLMADLLRAAASVPGFARTIRLHLVETSPHLRALQAERLGFADPRWHDRLEEVPDDLPLFVVANELFDALPIRQLQRGECFWVERRIGLDASDRLAFVLDAHPSPLADHLPASWREAPVGSIAEIAPAREALAAEIGRRVAARGGLGLVIDYGARPDAPGGDTLQAVRAHAFRPVLEAPGEADLTSHVDFGALIAAATHAGAACFGPIAQGEFLARIGIAARTERLCRDATADQARALRSAAARLIAPTAMGRLFRVLAITAAKGAPPPGFTIEERA